MYGERYVGKRTIHEVLRQDTFMTAIGEVAVAAPGGTNTTTAASVGPPSSGQDFFLVSMSLEDFRSELTREGRELKVQKKPSTKET